MTCGEIDLDGEGKADDTGIQMDGVRRRQEQLTCCVLQVTGDYGGSTPGIHKLGLERDIPFEIPVPYLIPCFLCFLPPYRMFGAIGGLPLGASYMPNECQARCCLRGCQRSHKSAASHLDANLRSLALSYNAKRGGRNTESPRESFHRNPCKQKVVCTNEG